MRFCEECGYSLLAKECPHCHKPVSAGMALCQHGMHPGNETRCSFCGEAKEADIGIAGGVGVGLLIKHGEIIQKVPEDQLLETLRQELLNWKE